MGMIINKTGSSNPKIILLNCIGNPLNYRSKNTLAIVDLCVNIRLAKQATKAMDPVIISNGMRARLPDGITQLNSIYQA